MQKISPKAISIVFSVLVVCFAVGSYIYGAWTEPTVAPPGNNVSAPINVGSIDQYKLGKLGAATSGIDTNYGLTVGLGVKITNTGTNPTFYAEDQASDPTPFIIDASGNVGIGTTEPQTKLDVRQGRIQVTNNGWASVTAKSYHVLHYPVFMGLRGQGTESAPAYPLAGNYLSSFLGRDVFDGYTQSTYGGGSMYVTATEDFSFANKGASLTFRTTLNGTNFPLERVIIDHNGNVGIGTTSPQSWAKLDVNGDVSIRGGAGATAVLTSEAGSKGLIIKARGGDYPDLFVSTNGNVGIGTTEPAQKLDVNGYVRGQTGLCIGNDCRTSWPSGGGGSAGQSAQVVGISNIQAPVSGSWEQMADMRIVMTTNGGNVFLMFSGTFTSSNDLGDLVLRFKIDGTAKHLIRYVVPDLKTDSGETHPISMQWLGTGLSAGVHIFTVEWSTGTTRRGRFWQNGTTYPRVFTAIE